MNKLIENLVLVHNFADIFGSDEECLSINNSAKTMMYQIFANEDYIADPKKYILLTSRFAHKPRYCKFFLSR